VQGPADILGVLADVFTWAGLGAAAVFGLVALIVKLADGTWLPVRAVVEHVADGTVVRWIDADGGVNEAAVAAHDLQRVGSHDMTDIFYRRGWRNRMRFTARAPIVHIAARVAIGFAALGVVALVGGWVLLAVRG
jgi:hypothetical protein